jgi:3-methyladenine DNA glycosylase Tag
VEITIYFWAEWPQENAKNQAGRAVSTNHLFDSRSSEQMARALHKREDRFTDDGQS